MENRYPLFAGGRILKKEALWDMRDYIYGSLQLHYADYTDGVLKGCRIRVEGSNLIVGKGIIKSEDFIYLLKEETFIPYTAGNRLTVLKAAFEKNTGHPDHLTYKIHFFLDNEPKRMGNQIELCRFHLRTGSVLRDEYQSFRDMGTEYDTVNLIDATVAGKGHATLHPLLLLRFAGELREKRERQPEDIAFCYQVQNTAGEISRELLEAYLLDKRKEYTPDEVEALDNTRIYKELENILSHQGKEAADLSRKVIYVE